MHPKFTVIIVCLNPGDKLKKTVESVLRQSCDDYEIVIKDGGSTDGSVETLQKTYPDREKLRFFSEADKSIYDAMNQAISHAQGEFLLFLNCGDCLYAPSVLEKVSESMASQPGAGIWYGDTFCEKTGALVASPPRITPFVCYRNIPCHQSCFYARELFDERQYDTVYPIRADYEHFLWCCLKRNVKPAYMRLTVSSYEGGGFSESRENQKKTKKEHKEITARYLTRGQLISYRLAMMLTLAPLRSYLAESRAFSGFYHKWKERLYR